MTRAAFTVGAFQCVTANAIKISPRAIGRGSTIIQNTGPNAIYIGPDSTVTILTGFKIASGQSLELDETAGDVWAIAETANQASPADTRVLNS